MFTDIPASVEKKSQKYPSPLHVRNSDSRPGAVYPAVLISAPSDRILVSKPVLCCTSNPHFNSSLSQDAAERAEWCDGEPRDAVQIPGNQSPRFRSSPSNVGGRAVLSWTYRRRKGGKKVFPAFGHNVD